MPSTHMNYMLEDGSRLMIATTRPETMFGDVAVAVNQELTLQDLIGKKYVIPSIANKLIPIVGDEHADLVGTEVSSLPTIKNDFLVGQRHNLPQVNVADDDGTMNDGLRILPRAWTVLKLHKGSRC